MDMKRARTPQAKEDRRQALLKAALDEFYEKGLTAARADDIAERAGLSKGTLYVYFKSKEDLFKALIENLTTPKLVILENIVSQTTSIETSLTRFSQLIPAIVRHSDMPKLMKILIGESQQFPEIVRLYRTNVLERVLGLLARMIESAQKRGEIRVEDPAIAARLLISPVFFSGVWQAVFAASDNEPLDVERLITTHIRFFLNAIKPGVTQ